MKILKLPQKRIPEAIDLANRVFRKGGGDMGRDYPALFSSENAQNILCIEEDGKIVSIFGLLFKDVQIFSARIKASLAGSVCTDERYRGRGYSTLLMKEAGDYSVKKGASLMMISGDNSIYRKFGSVDAGVYYAHFVDGNNSVEYHEATIDDLDNLMIFHAKNPVRFVRDRKTFKMMLETSKADNMPAKIFVSNKAYIVVTEGIVEKDNENRYHCVDHGGCQIDVANLVKSVASKMKPMVIHTTSADCTLNEIFMSEKSVRRRFIGTVKILDSALLLNQLRPYLEELPYDVKIIDDLSEMTKYVFGSTEYESKSLEIPLPDYGLDYV
ncbi:GNAT family N-acetyltransferase [Athalassotoga saccharophila]|uniref:GNAT family N-acetyltransferase n=1 Tax=Athalassotoga saccharophila TaxID=1441386 RepID=UPI001379D3FA|nr:GNAT family N-acetyltransferase [Athalassotoga saccharophila]BBJ28443.1 acetyltransferase (GNAT) family protein [Athalassotoga saccharophila]